MNIKDALELANKDFVKIGIINYFLETRDLLSFVLGKNKEWIMTHIDEELSTLEYSNFFELVNKRIQGEPLQYILGEQYFMGLKFIVNENVLIPRADTEILVYKVIDMIGDKTNIKILDMCTGSGCIAISLAKNIKCPEVFAVDISTEALKVAQENAKLNDVNVTFVESDLFDNLPEEKYDIIVSNPPYITINEMKNLESEVLKEPYQALYGGEDGLDFYKKISKNACKYLKEDGFLIFEIGYLQGNDVRNILKEFRYKNIEIIKDYSDNDRVIVSQK